MKYFGKRSLSSVMSGVMHVLRYAVVLMLILAPLLGFLIITASTREGELIFSKMSLSLPDVGVADFERSLNYTDAYEWARFSQLPLIVKIVMLPYFMAILLFLLFILKKAQLLFTNFKNDVVFSPGNVPLVSSISKMLIVFSILTFSFSSLLTSIVLMLVCEIIKNGADLQEDHDLTV